jgi:dolichol-phosphate mannosyltransferase
MESGCTAVDMLNPLTTTQAADPGVAPCAVAYSIVIPAFNEAENLEPLYAEIVAVMQDVEGGFEIIFVDDGSTDETGSVIRRLSRADDAVRAVLLRSNCGKTAALDAGFHAADGKFIVMMDADRQNDPRDIPRLIAYCDEADLVCGCRTRRRDRLSKRISSRVANSIRRAVLGGTIRDVNCGFKLFRRRCLKSVKLYRGMHRFLPVLFEMAGYRVVEVDVNDRPRVAGTSKFGLLNRLVGPFLDMLAVRWMRSAQLQYRIKHHVD